MIHCCRLAMSAYLGIIEKHAGESHSISHSNAALILKSKNIRAFFFRPLLIAQTTILDDNSYPIVSHSYLHLVTKMSEGGSWNIFSAESSHLAPEMPEGINKYDSCRRPEPGATLARENSRIHYVLSTPVRCVKCFSAWKCKMHSFQCTAASLQRHGGVDRRGSTEMRYQHAVIDSRLAGEEGKHDAEVGVLQLQPEGAAHLSPQ